MLDLVLTPDLYDREVDDGPEDPVEETIICTDLPTIIVERADPNTSSWGSSSICSGNRTTAYAAKLADRAIHLIPACAAIHREYFAEKRVLAACPLLHGDISTAAGVFNLPDDPIRIAPDAIIEWSGRPTARGAEEALAHWVTVHAERLAPRFEPSRIDGGSDGYANVKGVVSIETRPGLLFAPYEATWITIEGGFALKTLKVGDFNSESPRPVY